VFRKSAFQTITYKALEINYHPVARLHAEILLPRKRDSDGSVIGSTLHVCSALPTGVSEQTLLNAAITTSIVLHCSTNLCGG